MRAAGAPILAVLLALGACAPEGGTQPAAPAPREAPVPLGTGFDFYVLALSWSPSYCESAAGAANSRQCGAGRSHSFVVHGLWPQFERGYPTECGGADPYVPRALAESLADIMPSVGLVGHQWRRHGTCSGLGQLAYFEVVRRASERVAIPARFQAPDAAVDIDPRGVEEAFRDANPGLAATGMAVTCEGGLLEEVRICLTRSLEFRACPEVDRRGCRRRTVTLPAPDG